MSIQYITDSDGIQTGVIIPLQDWEALLQKHPDVLQDVDSIPEWQKELGRAELQRVRAGTAGQTRLKDAIKEFRR